MKNGINEIITNNIKLKAYTTNATSIAKYCNICISTFEILAVSVVAIIGYKVSTIFWIGDMKYVENLNILDANNTLSSTAETTEKKSRSFLP